MKKIVELGTDMVLGAEIVEMNFLEKVLDAAEKQGYNVITAMSADNDGNISIIGKNETKLSNSRI